MTICISLKLMKNAMGHWKNFLIRVCAKISTKCVLPKVLHLSQLVDFRQENNLWDYLNCYLFFMVDELLKKGNNFPITNDVIQERRKRWRKNVRTLRNMKKKSIQCFKRMKTRRILSLLLLVA